MEPWTKTCGFHGGEVLTHLQMEPSLPKECKDSCENHRGAPPNGWEDHVKQHVTCFGESFGSELAPRSGASTLCLVKELLQGMFSLHP